MHSNINSPSWKDQIMPIAVSEFFQSRWGTPMPSGRFHRIPGLLSALVIAALCLTWMWKTVAVEVFLAPPLGFADTFSAVLALAAIVHVSALVIRLGSDRTGNEE